MDLPVFNQTNLSQVWNTIHLNNHSSSLPDNGVVSFAPFLHQHIPPDAPVLDVGCGRGRNTRYLSHLGFTVYGCDWSGIALNEAKALAQTDSYPFYSVADLTQLPFPTGSFAAVCCVHVLPYLLLAHIRQGIGEMWRVLRQDGWLYIDLLDQADAEYGCGLKLEQDTYLDEDGVPLHFSTKSEVEMLFEDFLIQQQTLHELGRRIVWEIRARKESITT